MQRELLALVVPAGVINLKSSKTNKNKFERNQTDEFVVEAVDIGELRKIKCVLIFALFWPILFSIYWCTLRPELNGWMFGLL